jgi:nucleoside-diphosphate-sugar epimerase
MAAGHQLRLLVRNADKARDYYASLDVALPELVIGDVIDANSVKAALQGCDAVVHAAAGTPIGSDSVEQLFAVNVGGVKNVIGTAVDMGLQSIVHISSITAIFNADASKVTAEAEPATSSMPYGQSKVEAEHYVRKLQAKGAPVSIVYPGAIIGPNDPGLSDTFKALQHRINNGFRIIDDGGMQHIDVRDLAAFIVSLTVDGGGGRYLIPGIYCKWSELADIIEDVSGCQLQRIPAKGWKLRLVGRVMDFMRRFKTVDSPISAETMRYATLWPNIAMTDELAKRNLTLRSPQDTFRDSLAWMVAAGHLQAEQVPKLERP